MGGGETIAETTHLDIPKKKKSATNGEVFRQL